MHDARAAERCHRRAAELLAADDVVLSDGPPAALLAALDDATRAAVRWTSDPTAALTLCLISARAAAQDGSVVCAPDAGRCAHAARAIGIAVYVLLPHGPSVEHRTVQDLPHTPDGAIIHANQISAIVTARGIYRPAMLARHLSDGDAPLDVIPLLS